MTDVKIKDDIHSSEENFERFKELKEDYDVVLAEVQRDKSDFEWRNFDSIFGKLFCICGFLFFNLLGRAQRNNEPEHDVKSLDLEYHEMPKSLELIDKIKLGLFSGSLLLGIGYSLNPAYGLFVNVLLATFFSLFFLLLYFLAFVALVNVRREENMASTIEKNVSKGNTVLAYMGSGHASRVKSRLEENGLKVDREPITGLLRYLNLVIVLFIVILPRPIDYFRKGY